MNTLDRKRRESDAKLYRWVDDQVAAIQEAVRSGAWWEASRLSRDVASRLERRDWTGQA